MRLISRSDSSRRTFTSAPGDSSLNPQKTIEVLSPRSGGAADAASDGGDKTSVVFWGFNDESPGALVNVLRELSDRDINLTRIESRPRRVGLGHYMFFADLEGGAGEPQVADALDALRARVEELRVLGSYPSA